MSTIKNYMVRSNITLREMGELCNITYSHIYRISLPKGHKSYRRITNEIALKIEKGTKGRLKVSDLLETGQEQQLL
jgi:hypothetical protein